MKLLDFGWEAVETAQFLPPTLSNGNDRLVSVQDYLLVIDPRFVMRSIAVPIDLVAVDTQGLWIDFAATRGVRLQVFAEQGSRVRHKQRMGTLLKKRLVDNQICVDLELDSLESVTVQLTDCQLLLGKHNVEQQ